MRRADAQQHVGAPAPVIGYRLLPPAEEEMTEAALFYEQARTGFGDIFFDDLQHAIDAVRELPRIALGDEIPTPRYARRFET